MCIPTSISLNPHHAMLALIIGTLEDTVQSQESPDLVQHHVAQ
jgi:hypothetical protein